MAVVVPLPTVGGHNYVIHGIAGLLVSWLFLWTPAGVAASLIFAALTQAIDTARLYLFEKKRILQAPEEVRQELLAQFAKGAPLKFAQLYLIKVLWYALITLVVASLARAFVP